MEVKEILAPKNMMITLGTIVIIMSLYGMTHGDEWAEFGWGEDNVLAHDEAYEDCLLYTSPSPRDSMTSRMPSSA